MTVAVFVNEKGGKMCVRGEEGDLRKEESRKQLPGGVKTQLYWEKWIHNAQYFSEEKGKQNSSNFPMRKSILCRETRFDFFPFLNFGRVYTVEL